VPCQRHLAGRPGPKLGMIAHPGLCPLAPQYPSAPRHPYAPPHFCGHGVLQGGRAASLAGWADVSLLPAAAPTAQEAIKTQERALGMVDDLQEKLAIKSAAAQKQVRGGCRSTACAARRGAAQRSVM
jgi:hypothetical protein